jgi:hypothetical protein
MVSYTFLHPNKVLTKTPFLLAITALILTFAEQIMEKDIMLSCPYEASKGVVALLEAFLLHDKSVPDSMI